MTDQPQIPVAETNLAVGVHLIKPKSIKYFEYTAYISIGVSICLMIGEYVALYYFQHNSKTFSWSAFAVSIQPIVEGIFGLLFIWWFVIKKHANWARWLLLLSILVLLLGSIGGFFVAVTQAGFVYTLSLLSPSLMASFILSSLMLYFLFTSASNEWFNVSKETHEDSRVDSAKTSLEVQSFWVRPRTIKALDFSTMWSKVIQKTNNVFLIVFLVFTFPFLYEAHFEVSNLYSGIGIIMVFLLLVRMALGLHK